ncbi:MAG TPA: cupin domain-containing protein [Solirubrobacteraceae bacterium]|jgi:quercetin dioxygenase-like cupin family protein|nr:cupin domain-containing protein [Solirubrobacteraceae bacterium]
MAKTGDRMEMPDGSVYEITSSTADNDGEFVEMVFTLPAGSVAPPPHVHATPVEEYEVLEGKLDVMVGGDWKTLGPGDTASVPTGVLHTFKNRSGATVLVRNVHGPAARFEDYIEHICTLTRSRGIKSAMDPRIPIYLSMITLQYPETLAPARARERIPMTALAGVGRLLRFSTVP